MDVIVDCVLSIFGKIVVCSLKTVIIILVIFFIRCLCTKHVNPHFNYLLWLVLLVQLAFPIEIETPISPYCFMQIDDQVRSILASSGIRNSRMQGNSPLNPQPPTNTFITKSSPGPVISDNNRSILSSVFTVSAFVWLSGSIFIGLSIFIKNMRFRKIAGRSIGILDPELVRLFESCKNKLNIRSAITVKTSDSISMPCAYGIINPSIILPRSVIAAVTERELECIVIHELMHIKRKDIVVELVITILSIVYWFDPFARIAFRTMREDREYACDATVLACLGKERTTSYGLTLIKVLEALNQVRSPGCALGITDKKNNLTRRFRLITGFRKRSPYPVLILAALFLVCSTLVNTKPIVVADENSTNSEGQILFIPPIANPSITNEYGWAINPFSKDKYFHNGMDIGSPIGTTVKAVSDGRVIRTSNGTDRTTTNKVSTTIVENNKTKAWELSGTEYGNYVLVLHEGGFVSLYSKLDSIDVKENQQVKKGETIGRVGNTGISTGPHLHFSLFENETPVNPREYILF